MSLQAVRSLAVDALHAKTPAQAYWWERLMDDEGARQLIREIESEKGARQAHELICAERYQGIKVALETMNGTITGLKTEIGAIVVGAQKDKGRFDTLVRRVLIGLLLGVLGITGWLAGQVYALEPLRVAAAAHAAAPDPADPAALTPKP